ncbi:hypothetical protein ACFSHP_07865 [Novosphingobium panipatense]
MIVAGDADPAMLEGYVKKWFSDWSAKGQKPAAPDFGDPVAPPDADLKNPVGQTRVLVEPDLPPRSCTPSCARGSRLQTTSPTTRGL